MSVPPLCVNVCDGGGATALRHTLHLTRHLTVRNLTDRYRGSALGFAWSLLNPLLMMLVYTFVFSHVLRLSLEGVPYTCFFLANYLAWGCFAGGALHAGGSIIGSAHLIRRAPFPHIALPLSAVLAQAINFLAALPVLLIFNALFGIWPSVNLLLLLALLPLLVAQALAVGLLLAALALRFRDMLHLAEVLFTAWFFLSPVIYPMTMLQGELSDPLLTLYQCNPIVGSLTLMQSAFHHQPISAVPLLISVALTVAVLLLAAALFRRQMRDVGELV